MTLYEWRCVVDGWQKANGGKSDVTFPTDEEFDAAVAATRH